MRILSLIPTEITLPFLIWLFQNFLLACSVFMLKCTHNPATGPSLVKLLSWGWNPDLSDFKSRSFSLTCLCLSQPHSLPLSKCDLTSYSEQKSFIIFDTFDYSFLLKTWFPGHHNLLIFLLFRGHLFSVFFWFLISESFFYECP